MKRLAAFICILALLFSIFGFITITVKAESQPQEILSVSLPDGTPIGVDPDPWLNEGWNLTVYGNEGSFVVRVNRTLDPDYPYFATWGIHLIIALNDYAHDNLVELIVDALGLPITMHKTDFQYGVPCPGGLWNWSDDVYPTWFNDTAFVGSLLDHPMFNYANVTVSAKFLNASCAKMHFDAYGSTFNCGLTSLDQLVVNSNKTDSTVVFAHPKECKVTFLTSPVCSDFYITFGGVDYHNGSVGTFAYGTSDSAAAHCACGYVFDHWETTGNVAVSSTTANPTCVTITCGGTLKAICRSACPCVASFAATQHSPEVTFDASSSYDPDGYIVSYMWNFGDGSISLVFDPVVLHKYSAAGTYEVTLTVTDNDGLTHSVKQNVTITILVGDLNSDGIVNIVDVTMVARAFRLKLGDPGWDGKVDVDNNGVVDIRDIAKVAKEYGKTY